MKHFLYIYQVSTLAVLSVIPSRTTGRYTAGISWSGSLVHTCKLGQASKTVCILPVQPQAIGTSLKSLIEERKTL